MAFHAVAFAFDDDGVGPVQDAVEDGAGEAGIVIEDFGPALVLQVGGEDQRALFVALADELEDEISADLVERHVSKLITHQNAWRQVPAELGAEPVGGLGGHQPVEHVDRAGVQHGN